MNSKYKGRKLTPFPKISQESKQLGREGAGPRPRGPLDIWTKFGGARGSGWAARGAKGALEAPTRGRLTWESMGSQAQGSHKVPPGRDWGGHRGGGDGPGGQRACPTWGGVDGAGPGSRGRAWEAGLYRQCTGAWASGWGEKSWRPCLEAETGRLQGELTPGRRGPSGRPDGPGGEAS